MYQWMNRHLNLGLDDPVIEQDFEPLTDEEMAVWNDEHPAPTEMGFVHQRNFCRWLDQQSNEKLAAIAPKDEESLGTFRDTVGGAWRVIFDQGVPESVEYKKLTSEDQDGLMIEKGVVSVADRNTMLPLLTIRKPGGNSDRVLIWTDETGKSAAFLENGAPDPLLRELVDAGNTVLLPDLFHQGELLVEGTDAKYQPLIDDNRPYSAFTFCYNRTAVVRRSADVLAVIAHASAQEPKSMGLLGTGSAALWVAPAAMHAGPLVDRVAIVDGSVRFSHADSYRDVRFVPGAVKYGDLPALLALRAPYRLTVLAEPQIPVIVQQAYASAGKVDQVRWQTAENATAAIVSWAKQD